MDGHRQRKRREGIFVCVVILVLAVVFFFWFRPRLLAYNSAEKISAQVSRCDHDRISHVSKDDETHYDVYVNYSFQGKKYTDVYWKTRKSSLAKGSEVTIRIHPEHPESPIPGSPYTGVVIVLPCLLWGLYYGIRRIFDPRPDTKITTLRKF